jgi:hypothetical protein
MIDGLVPVDTVDVRSLPNSGEWGKAEKQSVGWQITRCSATEVVPGGTEERVTTT